MLDQGWAGCTPPCGALFLPAPIWRFSPWGVCVHIGIRGRGKTQSLATETRPSLATIRLVELGSPWPVGCVCFGSRLTVFAVVSWQFVGPLAGWSVRAQAALLPFDLPGLVRIEKVEFSSVSEPTIKRVVTIRGAVG